MPETTSTLPLDHDRSGATRTLIVTPWTDAVIDKIGHDPRARYVERFWLGVIGPTSVWLLRSSAWRFDSESDGFTIDAADLSAELGLGRGIGKASQLARTIDRCAKFGLLRKVDTDQLEVRRRVPPLYSGWSLACPTN